MLFAKSILSSVSAVTDYAAGHLAITGHFPGNLSSKDNKKTNFIPRFSSLEGGVGAFKIDGSICFFYLPLVCEVFDLQTTLASC